LLATTRKNAKKGIPFYFFQKKSFRKLKKVAVMFFSSATKKLLVFNF